MAGSYSHCVNDAGKLLCNEDVSDMLENGGDVYETVEQMYGMIWFLASGDPSRVLHAYANWSQGLLISPGVLEESVFPELPED